MPATRQKLNMSSLFIERLEQEGISNSSIESFIIFIFPFLKVSTERILLSLLSHHDFTLLQLKAISSNLSADAIVDMYVSVYESKTGEKVDTLISRLLDDWMPIWEALKQNFVNIELQVNTLSPKDREIYLDNLIEEYLEELMNLE